MNNPPYLGADDIVVRVEGRALLEHAKFCVDKGEIVALLGPSGSGKTTLLRALAGLTLSDGEVFVRRMLATDWAPSKRKISMLFQDPALFPRMTVRNNCFLWSKAPGHDSEFGNVYAALAQDFKIEHFETKRIENLSGGERQRAAIVRLLCSPHDIVFLDEPVKSLFSVQDRANLTRELRNTLRRLNKTAIVVTHEVDEAAQICDRLLIIDESKVVSGTFQALLENPPSIRVAEVLSQGLKVDAEFLDPEWRQENFPIRLTNQPKTRADNAKTVHVRATDIVIEQGGGFVVQRTFESSGRTMLDIRKESGGKHFCVIAPSKTSHAVNTKIGLSVDPKAIRLFDSSGNRLENSSD